MQRFLGLSEEELAENERLWREENEENLEPIPGDASSEMRDAGISSAGISADLSGLEDVAPEAGEAPVEGGDTAGPETVTGQELGATTPGTGQTI